MLLIEQLISSSNKDNCSVLVTDHYLFCVKLLIGWLWLIQVTKVD